jgi:starch phosphorylase
MPYLRSAKEVPARPRFEDGDALRTAILAKLTYSRGTDISQATPHDWFLATALTVRDRIVDRWLKTEQRFKGSSSKHVCYLSIEYLIGRLLFDALNNLGLLESARAALASLGIDFDELQSLEPDAALGSGGLGRLAACYMDSMASVGIPAVGYGIRYQHGLFTQQISDGMQRELPDEWLSLANPWEFERPEVVFPIGFGGAVEYVGGDADTARSIWYPADTVLAVAYDTPLVGWRGHHVNTLRLWSARPAEPIQLHAHHQGDYLGAMAARAHAEAITRTLYPSDATPAGQELRLQQEYFFTSASLQDIVHRHLQRNQSLRNLPEQAAIQLNDTHPAIAVAELMRILLDEHDFSWAHAWRITTETLNYTNHTLLPEALEAWPVALMNKLLPRHLQIIFLINWLHLKDVTKDANLDANTIEALSLIEEAHDKRVRMGHLAFVGSHKVNGVSTMHTELLRRTVFGSFDTLRPGKIVNKTNGISFRRWLYHANPGLTSLLIDAIGDQWLDDPNRLTELDRVAADSAFVHRYARTRLNNKAALAGRIRELTGTSVDPAAMFDVQVKRIHEYKRQLLNILEAIALFNAIREQPQRDWMPRVKVIAGKAAMNYTRAKLIIKLIHDVAHVVNSDPVVGDRLKIVFLPNYGVSLAERIIPAADLSEQISTAGMEASGTGNMKLALNGAVTIGTLDGANVEICERVGKDNLFIFGLTAEQVSERRRSQLGGHDAVRASPILESVLASIASGAFSPREPDRFQALVDDLMNGDHFMVAADFDTYWQTQRSIDELWGRPADWWRSSIMNTARMGWFSSDRAVLEYADEIWGITRPSPSIRATG